MADKLDTYKETFRVLRDNSTFKKLSGIFMVVCCVLPIAAILLLPRMGVALSQGAWIAIVMLCPVSHVLMMRFMHGRSKERTGCHSADEREV